MEVDHLVEGWPSMYKALGSTLSVVGGTGIGAFRRWRPEVWELKVVLA